MKLGYQGPAIGPGGFPGSLLVTGQITPYSSKEDDGHFEKGLSRDYTVLSTGDYSGTTAIVLNGKTLNQSNNCVIDNRTGLMWARYAAGSGIGPDNNGYLFWVDSIGGNGEDIFGYKDVANIAELAGHNDWRVPNFFELAGLLVLDAGIGTPYIDTTTFPSTPGNYHWTATTVASATTQAMIVGFQNAVASSNVKNTQKFACRLVRGG